jgi:hypothetical protein
MYQQDAQADYLPQIDEGIGFDHSPVLEIDVEKLDLTNRIHVGYIFERVLEILKTQD